MPSVFGYYFPMAVKCRAQILNPGWAEDRTAFPFLFDIFIIHKLNIQTKSTPNFGVLFVFKKG